MLIMPLQVPRAFLFSRIWAGMAGMAGMAEAETCRSGNGQNLAFFALPINDFLPSLYLSRAHEKRGRGPEARG